MSLPHLITRIRLVQERKAVGVLLPVKIGAVDDDAADRGAMAADVFGRRMHDDGRTMLDRPAENRGGGIVDDQRYTELASDPRHFADRQDLELRVGQDFGIIKRVRASVSHRSPWGRPVGKADLRPHGLHHRVEKQFQVPP